MADQEGPQSPQPGNSGVFQEQDCRQTIYAANFENRMMVQDVDLVTRQSAAQSLQLDQQASQPQASQPQASQPQAQSPKTNK